MTLPVIYHRWDVPPAEAVAIQRRLASHFVQGPAPWPPGLVAGVDVGIRGDTARAAVIVLSFPDLEVVEGQVAECPVAFPYIPGLLSFREAPAILKAMAALKHEPDVWLFDGQGYAHPRRMGIATHLGILLDKPAVGCAKSRLCGTYEEPSEERGSWSPLEDGEEIIGAVLRTRSRVKPLYISVGHRVTLEYAVQLVLACGTGFRLPEPIRQAHRLASLDSQALNIAQH